MARRCTGSSASQCPSTGPLSWRSPRIPRRRRRLCPRTDPAGRCAWMRTGPGRARAAAAPGKAAVLSGPRCIACCGLEAPNSLTVVGGYARVADSDSTTVRDRAEPERANARGAGAALGDHEQASGEQTYLTAVDPRVCRTRRYEYLSGESGAGDPGTWVTGYCPNHVGERTLPPNLYAQRVPDAGQHCRQIGLFCALAAEEEPTISAAGPRSLGLTRCRSREILSQTLKGTPLAREQVPGRLVLCGLGTGRGSGTALKTAGKDGLVAGLARSPLRDLPAGSGSPQAMGAPRIGCRQTVRGRPATMTFTRWVQPRRRTSAHPQ